MKPQDTHDAIQSKLTIVTDATAKKPPKSGTWYIKYSYSPNKYDVIDVY